MLNLKRGYYLGYTKTTFHVTSDQNKIADLWNYSQLSYLTNQISSFWANHK